MYYNQEKQKTKVIEKLFFECCKEESKFLGVDS